MNRGFLKRNSTFLILAAIVSFSVANRVQARQAQSSGTARQPNNKQFFDEQEKKLLAEVQTVESSGAKPEDLADALARLARFYESHNRKAELARVLDRELAVAEQAWPADDLDKVKVLQQIANGYALCNERDRAEQLFRRVLDVHNKLYGLMSQYVASDLVQLGRVTMFKTDSSSSEEYLMKALAIDQLLHNDRDTSTVIQMLSTVAKIQKDPDKADLLLTRALEALQPHADLNALQISQLLFQRANIAAGRKDFNSAIDYTRQILAIDRAHYPQNSPTVLATLNNLSNFYLANNDLNSATETIQQTLELAQEADQASPSRADEVGPLSAMGHLYLQEKKYPEAEAAVKRALELLANVRGKDDPSLTHLTIQIAYLYAVQERNAEAEVQYRRAIALAESDQNGIIGHSMPEFLAEYAFFLRKINRNEEADKLLKRARDIVEKRRAAVQNQTPQI